MAWKVCSKCKTPKPPEDYSSKTSGYCRPCFKEYRKGEYVPVTAGAKAKMAADPAWRVKHNKKRCEACGRFGTEVIFKSLHRRRCSDCESKHIFRCKTHGRVRSWPCHHCVRKSAKAYRRRKKAEKMAEVEKSVLMIQGDGCCANCGKRIRQGKTIDRSHICQ